MALVVLSVVEQRLDAVRAVLDGAEVTEVVARMGSTGRLCTGGWARYLSGQLPSGRRMPGRRPWLDSFTQAKPFWVI